MSEILPLFLSKILAASPSHFLPRPNNKYSKTYKGEFPSRKLSPRQSAIKQPQLIPKLAKKLKRLLYASRKLVAQPRIVK